MGKTIVGHLGAMALLLIATQGGAMEMKRHDLTTITGTVRVVGNEPFTRLVLTTGGEGRDYLLAGPLRDQLRRGYQGSVVTLEGKECPSPGPESAHCFEPSRIVAR